MEPKQSTPLSENKIVIPPGLPSMLEQIAKAVLIKQPKDIYKFSIHFLNACVQRRNLALEIDNQFILDFEYYDGMNADKWLNQNMTQSYGGPSKETWLLQNSPLSPTKRDKDVSRDSGLSRSNEYAGTGGIYHQQKATGLDNRNDLQGTSTKKFAKKIGMSDESEDISSEGEKNVDDDGEPIKEYSLRTKVSNNQKSELSNHGKTNKIQGNELLSDKTIHMNVHDAELSPTIKLNLIQTASHSPTEAYHSKETVFDDLSTAPVIPLSPTKKMVAGSNKNNKTAEPESPTHPFSYDFSGGYTQDESSYGDIADVTSATNAKNQNNIHLEQGKQSGAHHDNPMGDGLTHDYMLDNNSGDENIEDTLAKTTTSRKEKLSTSSYHMIPNSTPQAQNENKLLPNNDNIPSSDLNQATYKTVRTLPPLPVSNNATPTGSPQKQEKGQNKDFSYDNQGFKEDSMEFNHNEKHKLQGSHNRLNKNKPHRFDENPDEAATLIQALYKGYRTRKKLNMNGQTENLSPSTEKALFDDDLVKEAAIKIQAAFKGHLTRKEVRDYIAHLPTSDHRYDLLKKDLLLDKKSSNENDQSKKHPKQGDVTLLHSPNDSKISDNSNISPSHSAFDKAQSTTNHTNPPNTLTPSTSSNDGKTNKLGHSKFATPSPDENSEEYSGFLDSAAIVIQSAFKNYLQRKRHSHDMIETTKTQNNLNTNADNIINTRKMSVNQ